MKATGIDTMGYSLAAKTPLKMAGNAPGTVTVDTPKNLKAALGLPAQYLEKGYRLGRRQVRVQALPRSDPEL